MYYIIIYHLPTSIRPRNTRYYLESKFMVPKILEYYQFDTVKFEFSFVCEYLSFWDVYFRFRIGDGAWENLFWWLILVTVSKSNVPRHYGILSANVFTWDSLFIQSFFLSRTVSDPLKIAVLLRYITETVSIRNVARFVLRMWNNRNIDDLGTLINGHLSIINYN